MVAGDCETEQTQKVKFIKVKKVKCHRSGYENTTKQARPQKRVKRKNKKKKTKQNKAEQTTGVLMDHVMQEDGKGKARLHCQRNTII